MKIMKLSIERKVFQKVKDKMIKLAELARNIIDETSDKEIREYGKMMSTTIRITDEQEKRLKRVKPHNFSKFISDKIKEKVK